MVARTLLAFLASAGLFYVNIMPALVSGLIEALQFSKEDAGLVASFNVYGAALGALAAVFVVKTWSWRKTSVVLLIALIACDLISILLSEPLTLMVVRFIHGSIGGLLVGVGFSIIARTKEADKTFGVLLLVQFGLGGVGVIYIPPLVPEYGTSVLFASLIAFSVCTLLMLPFIPHYQNNANPRKGVQQSVKRLPLAAALLALFLFQAANMGLYAYIIDLGVVAGLQTEQVSTIVGISAWFGILGSVLVVWLSTRVGRGFPLVIGIVFTAINTFVLHYAQQEWLFWLANINIAIAWAFVIPYILGLCSEFDRQGQMAALGGFASKMGLASGPLAAALMVGGFSYSVLINIAVLVLLLSLIVTWWPARMLDRES
ncbi:MFS transporter [Thalassotalea mangrovi]|uniref:MFS transporter n=2 Tax=Thalassotalea mangrovi TaxID=2572245 RepID=A0A4U1B4Z3_9GAMM|nr:MFS transporter [Thalassotalea mangrovi]